MTCWVRPATWWSWAGAWRWFLTGQVLADLPLPVAGLLSLAPLEEVTRAHRRLREAYRSLGGSLDDPFMTLSFLSLEVIPALKVTDLGLVDVNRFQVVPLFGEA